MNGRDEGELAFLRSYVAERDVACPGCGYNLRGLTSNRCPECNEALAVSVSLREPKQTAYLIGLVGLAAGAGFNVFVVLMWAFASFRRGFDFDFQRWLVYSMIAGVIGGALVLAWLMKRLQLRRLSSVLRACLAIAAWALAMRNAGSLRC